ncbi:type IV secretion system protein VirB10 [Pasteurella atlantica]|uniref:type IV secretion system protein VirB10 n=1 Tax=Phocoenobacter atlanticus TaxID=3416742 RepID=UPI00274B2691|nr:type IV secretion system protein VirB10 [Pasteurella atlantica]MDP8042530.1 type IV secretion system protein VirB10 [Pasteurella atlantica]
MSNTQNNRTGSQIPKTKNNKSGSIIVILFILLVFSLFIIPKIISFNKNETEVQKVQQEESINIVKKDNFVTEDKEKKQEEVKKFSFEEEKKVIEDKPPQLLGEEYQEKMPKLIKSVGALMKKTGGKTTREYENRSTYNTDDESSNIAIEQAKQTLEYFKKNNISDDKKLGADSDMFSSPAFSPKVAKKSKYNPHLLLEQGTVIPCSLRGRLVSNIGGQIGCIITDNVYSQSGSVLLIEKGSKINGFYKGNNVSHGHSEIFVVWKEVRTPNNLIIPLDSGSTDELGANGLHGYVDNHFFERFGNAIVLSLIKDISGVLADKATKGNRRDSIENTREGTEDLAKTVLSQMGDIKPTLYKNQGDKINIYVARDIDFSSVYSLEKSR